MTNHGESSKVIENKEDSFFINQTSADVGSFLSCGFCGGTD